MTGQPAYTDADVQAAALASCACQAAPAEKHEPSQRIDCAWTDTCVRSALDAVVPGIVARAKAEALAPVRELLAAWDAIPDYMPSHYDRGRVDQRHMAAEELATVLDRADEIEAGR